MDLKLGVTQSHSPQEKAFGSYNLFTARMSPLEGRSGDLIMLPSFFDSGNFSSPTSLEPECEPYIMIEPTSNEPSSRKSFRFLSKGTKSRPENVNELSDAKSA